MFSINSNRRNTRGSWNARGGLLPAPLRDTQRARRCAAPTSARAAARHPARAPLRGTHQRARRMNTTHAVQQRYHRYLSPKMCRRRVTYSVLCSHVMNHFCNTTQNTIRHTSSTHFGRKVPLVALVEITRYTGNASLNQKAALHGVTRRSARNIALFRALRLAADFLSAAGT